MQTRCYRCSYLLSDGIPPMEALSEAQVNNLDGALLDIDNIHRFRSLSGTKYEGMSVYSFCAFCLYTITEFPSTDNSPCEMYRLREEDWKAPIQYIGAACRTHGELYKKEINADKNESFTRFDETLLNRSFILHSVETVYKAADLSFLRSLMEMEA